MASRGGGRARAPGRGRGRDEVAHAVGEVVHLHHRGGRGIGEFDEQRFADRDGRGPVPGAGAHSVEQRQEPPEEQRLVFPEHSRLVVLVVVDDRAVARADGVELEAAVEGRVTGGRELGVRVELEELTGDELRRRHVDRRRRLACSRRGR